MNGAPGWDAIVVLVYVIGIGYNVILHREKIAGHIAAAYIALAVTAVIAHPVYDFVHGSKLLASQAWITHAATADNTAALVFLALTIMLSSFLAISPTGRRSDDLSAIEAFLYAFLWVTLVISSILSFMPDDHRATYLSQSKFLTLIWQYHTAWLVIPALLFLYSGFRRGSMRN